MSIGWLQRCMGYLPSSAGPTDQVEDVAWLDGASASLCALFVDLNHDPTQYVERR